MNGPQGSPVVPVHIRGSFRRRVRLAHSLAPSVQKRGAGCTTATTNGGQRPGNRRDGSSGAHLVPVGP